MDLEFRNREKFWVKRGIHLEKNTYKNKSHQGSVAVQGQVRFQLYYIITVLVSYPLFGRLGGK